MTSTWEPSASITILRRRAEILSQIRDFFKEKGVLEVQTPSLSLSTVTDPHLQSFDTFYHNNGHPPQKLYLQTSPEFSMKRLLAKGSGSIYQITHAFRNQNEKGRWHNPEFTLLEWYRVNFNLQQLMDETENLLQCILKCPLAERITYTQLFKSYLRINPHQATLHQIKKALSHFKIHLEPDHWLTDRDTGLQLLLDHIVQHHIDLHRPLFLYDFPCSQAALARIRKDAQPVAERVEVYYQGLELANGFYELADPNEQKERFLKDLTIRKQNQLSEIPFDQRLLQALQYGLPDCSGIALGVDRLVALATHQSSLADVMSFSIDRA
jgi:lysyl-tRNA synthetase class 2